MIQVGQPINGLISRLQEPQFLCQVMTRIRVRTLLGLPFPTMEKTTPRFVLARMVSSVLLAHLALIRILAYHLQVHQRHC